MNDDAKALVERLRNPWAETEPVDGRLCREAAAAIERLERELAEVQRVPSEVVDELGRAVAKFPTWPTDPLHALAVLGEEFGELTKAVLQLTYEPHKSSIEEMRGEAVQTAAMALRFVASLDAYRFQRCNQHRQRADFDAAMGESDGR